MTTVKTFEEVIEFFLVDLPSHYLHLVSLETKDKMLLIDYAHAVIGLKQKGTNIVTIFVEWQGHSKTTSKMINLLWTTAQKRNMQIIEIESEKPETKDFLFTRSNISPTFRKL